MSLTLEASSNVTDTIPVPSTDQLKSLIKWTESSHDLEKIVDNAVGGKLGRLSDQPDTLQKQTITSDQKVKSGDKAFRKTHIVKPEKGCVVDTKNKPDALRKTTKTDFKDVESDGEGDMVESTPAQTLWDTEASGMDTYQESDDDFIEIRNRRKRKREQNNIPDQSTKVQKPLSNRTG